MATERETTYDTYLTAEEDLGSKLLDIVYVEHQLVNVCLWLVAQHAAQQQQQRQQQLEQVLESLQLVPGPLPQVQQALEQAQECLVKELKQGQGPPPPKLQAGWHAELAAWTAALGVAKGAIPQLFEQFLKCAADMAGEVLLPEECVSGGVRFGELPVWRQWDIFSQASSLVTWEEHRNMVELCLATPLQQFSGWKGWLVPFFGGALCVFALAGKPADTANMRVALMVLWPIWVATLVFPVIAFTPATSKLVTGKWQVVALLLTTLLATGIALILLWRNDIPQRQMDVDMLEKDRMASHTLMWEADADNVQPLSALAGRLTQTKKQAMVARSKFVRRLRP